MKDIRNLLLDCRTALRRADRQFEDSTLADQLGEAILRISREHEPPPPSEAALARPHAQRIAYAWQAAARELRATHPEVHALLSARVFERLGEEVLDDAADEIETLRGQLQLRDTANAALARELDEARAAVPAPVAVMASVPTRPAVSFAADPYTAAGPAASDPFPGGPSAGERFAADPFPEEDPHVPSRGLLQAVAAGQRRLGDSHRDWCVAEAMVLTAFERTPLQLLEEGDVALATRVLAAMATG